MPNTETTSLVLPSTTEMVRHYREAKRTGNMVPFLTLLSTYREIDPLAIVVADREYGDLD